MDKDILDMFNLLIDKIDGMGQHLEEKMETMLDCKLDEKLDALVDGKMEAMVGRKLDEKLEEKLEQKLNEKLDEKLGETERRIMVYVENNITKRLDALTDGYKLNYEQNDITETRVDALGDKVDTLENRVTVLEQAG